MTKALVLAVTFVVPVLAGPLRAEAPERSVLPQPRPVVAPPTVSTPATTTIRPGGPPEGTDPLATPLSAVRAMSDPPPIDEVAAAFDDWLAGFRKRALAQGIRPEVLDRALTGLKFQASIVERDRNQAEFSKQIWDYLDTAVSDARILNGRQAMARKRALLDEIEARYGVEKETIAAIWGLESAYGAFRGSSSTIEALATLASDPRRGAFFEAQLLAALRILQSGDVSARNMVGSWAGAMGHTQFMPGSYLAHAQDFDGDGRRDIWGDDPADALASAAAYLRHHGWTRGQPWGIEVRLPRGFDYSETTERVKRPVSYWMSRGVRALDGREVPEHGASSVLLPAGHLGPAFLIFDNFHVLENYNTADAYVIAVGHLSDRLLGGPPISGSWPRTDRALTFAEKKELQRLLLAQGFDPQGIDGIIGPRTIAALQDWQSSVGRVPDGYVSLRALQGLR